MQNTETSEKPSFFDDPGASDDFLFWKNVSSHPKKFSEVKHIEGILFKQSKRTSFWKSRYYVLFDDRLAYFKVSCIQFPLSNFNINLEWQRKKGDCLLPPSKYENGKA